jgi:hypothetical protein
MAKKTKKVDKIEAVEGRVANAVEIPWWLAPGM